ncbi:MAG: FAD-binding oxidoreductase [Actinomycetia bacterium]|nr:FAD-binding oxidoreductase [Actinomycetes bacterium]
MGHGVHRCGVPVTGSTLAGWGLTAPTVAEVATAACIGDVGRLVRSAGDRGLAARGLGRSYGDAAQNAGGTVVDMTGLDGIGPIGDDGAITVQGGVSLDTLLRRIVPSAWFVPVSPGTRQVTIGGAIACDVHGKNHHRDGSWGDHVRSLRLLTGDGQIREIGPRGPDPDLFRATVGGMGLTGVILEATIHLVAVPSSRLVVDTDRAPDLDAALQLLEAGDSRYRYSVAWIDSTASGRHLGRSVITQGDFAPADCVGGVGDIHRFDPRPGPSAPPVPSGLLNRHTVKAFNETWYRKAPESRSGEIQSISTFFHPLDGVERWNRLYGPRGMVQWQMVVPPEASPVVALAIEALIEAGAPSFLSVLKRFGPGDIGPLSFPTAGWTLALDLPARTPGLSVVLDRLDETVAEVGGRIYLAKDARLRPQLLPVMYPRLGELTAARSRTDPDSRISTDLGRRLGVC